MKWIIAEQPDLDQLGHLMNVLRVPKVVAQILLNRGVTTFEEAKAFFTSDWEDLHDPFLMKDMDKAVDRIIRALNNNERIFISGDYDVDGITAVSLLTLFLKDLGSEAIFYIPDRLKEGYGLSHTGVQYACEAGATLLISVDCGITALEEVADARKKGLDIIISDHHESGRDLPDAVAILDPKRQDETYPFRELAGVGVAYKLVHAVASKLGLDEQSWKQYVDLVALGSAADIVPLVDENRVLVKKGLEKINMHERIGLRALVEICGLRGKPIGTGQIVFILAPRINAVGRMGNAERAVRLLITDSEPQAGDIAAILEKANQTRKNIDEETYQEAIQILESEPCLQDARALVLAKEGWHPGVIGIVASRISERMYRPTIMIAIEDGIGKGSARSISNFDIYSALKECETHLLGFGGHRYAAGLMIELEQIDHFREAFNEVALRTISDGDLIQRLNVDAEIMLPEINDKLLRLLNRFAPFGPRNMRPVFLSRNLQVVGTPRIVGRNHLKFRVRQSGEVFEAIGFDLGDLQYRLTPGEDNLDMVYVIEENVWNGKKTIQLRVKDLR